MLKPKVSICVVSFNQYKYIKKCILSIVNQRVDFDYEIIIGDDCSTDGTQEIIKEIANQYPSLIRLVFHEENVGPFKNYISVHALAKGEYIAHIDGDDWCDAEKIALQSKFLDENNECAAVVHKLQKFDIDGNSLNSCWPERFTRNFYDLSQLALLHCEFGHSSLMYRKNVFDAEKEIGFLSVIDFYVYVILASRGHIAVIDRVLGSYTYGGGISHNSNLYKYVVDALQKALQLGLPVKTFHHALARQYLLFSKRALDEYDVNLFQKLISLSFKEKLFSIQQVLLFFFKGNIWLIRGFAKFYRIFKYKIAGI